MGGWRSWVLLLLVIAAGLGVMEAMVRAVRPQVLVRAYGVADAEIGTVLRANTRYHDVFGNDYHVETNALALRQPDERDFARNGVAFYGDSFTFGFGVEYPQSYFAHLKEGIEARRFDLQLLNAAIPGFSSGHVAKLMARQVDTLRPAALVYFFNNNDLIDNVIADIDYRVTTFSIDTGGNVRLDDVPPFAPWKRFLLTRTPYGWLNQHSHLFVLAKDVLKKALNRDRQLEVPEIDTVDAPLAAMPAGPAYTIRLQTPLPRHSIDTVVAVSLAHVERIADLAARAGLPLLLVWVPHPDEMEDVPEPTPVLGLLTRGRAALAELAARRGDFVFLDTVETIPADADWRRRAPALRFVGDGHFNADGNAWFAAHVEAGVRRFLDERLPSPQK